MTRIWYPQRPVASGELGSIATPMRHFARHACIDWSGAATPRQPGIAVAATQDGARLTLLRPDGGWTRQRILGWLETLAEQETDILL
ncbi:MAG: hypothetical protein K2X31_02590, partial [Sphingopyxis sp.]|nr:hypothetical protein [Sphingopyxis sp.]